MNNIIDEIDRAFAAVNEPSGDHEKDGRLQMLIEQHWPSLRDRLREAERRAKAFDAIASREISVHSVSRMDTPYGFCWTVRATPYDMRNITHPDLLTAIEAALETTTDA